MPLPRGPGGLTTVSIASLVVLAVARLAAQPPETPPDWEALDKGKIIVEQAKSDRGTPGLRCYFLVAGNKDRLFDKLKNPDFFKAAYSNIEKLKTLRKYKNGAELEFVVNAIIKKVRYVVLRRYSRDTYTVRWTRVSGDLKDIEGSWRLEPSPFDGKYLIVYESFVDPGVVVAGFYVFFAKLQAESNLKKLRIALEE